MGRDSTIEMVQTNLVEHPALVAWRTLGPERVAPESIMVLKKKGHSTVYRLEGVGPGGSAVIAKRCKSRAAMSERSIYEDILPSLPVPTVRFYGFLEEDCERTRDGRCWLFLEDAGDENCSGLVEEHRKLAGRWLGTMHSFAARLAGAISLPDRGPSYYLHELRVARDRVRQCLTNPVLNDEDVATLNALLSQCDVIELHWDEVVRSCEGMPRTLVHGDLKLKNARVRPASDGNSLVVMDWETSGWGVPAIDLAQSADLLSPDISAYWSAVQPRWPHVDLRDLEEWAAIGKIFRFIVAVSWETANLRSQWVLKPMIHMRFYQARLAESIKLAGWGN